MAVVVSTAPTIGREKSKNYPILPIVLFSTMGRGFASTSLENVAPHAHIFYHPPPQGTGLSATTPVAHEWKRYPDHRKHADYHPDIDERLPQDICAHPHHDSASRTCPWPSGNPEGKEYEQTKQEKQNRAPYKSPFFGPDGKNEVGICFSGRKWSLFCVH